MNAHNTAFDATLLAARVARMQQTFASQNVVLADGASVSIRRCGVQSALMPVVLLHGISSGAASWFDVAMHLAPHTEVIAWDAPGYGDSSALTMVDPSADDYARVVLSLLQALNVSRCLMVGHSLGALVALACSRQAAVVQHAVLLDPARGYGGEQQRAEQEKVKTGRLEALQRLGVSGLADALPARMLAAPDRADAAAWIRWNAERMTVHGYAQAVAMLCQSQLETGDACRVSVEVHCGDADIVTTPAACQAWAQQYGYPFALIAQAGHASPVEQPETVAALILRALHKGGALKPDAKHATVLEVTTP